MRPATQLLMPLAILTMLGSAVCRRSPTVSNEVVAIPMSSIPSSPADTAWENAPEHVAALLLQDVVDPRLMEASTREVRVRAATDGSSIGFRLEWLDSGKDDVPGPGLAVDGCAVQLPRTIMKEPPNPQMGEAGKPVEVTFWRADWQAFVDGRSDVIQALYPNATVDHYPFQAQPLQADAGGQNDMAMRYLPAQALGNRRTGPRASPVEDMVAEGPGTLNRDAGSVSSGKGIRTKDGWMVALNRRLPAGLDPGKRTQVAFAVWEGAKGESGSRKMRTGWIPLMRRAAL